ncbi:MAG: amidase family protein, partial [Burkholderiales bacterium]
MNTDPTRAGVAQLAQALLRRQVGARELLEAFLERIGRLNEPLNALTTLDTDRALDRAGAIDSARGRGEALPALAGIPVTIK